MSRHEEDRLNGKDWGTPPDPPPPKSEEPAEKRERPWLARLAIATLAGLLLAGLQVGGLVATAPGKTLSSQYHELFQHDSFWFENIVRRGYGSPVPPVPFKAFEVSNVAFLPGYPLAASVVTRLFATDTRTGLLLVAQFAAWLFWAYAFAFLLSWRTPFWLALAGVGLIAAHPAAFFLVAAYSESLFLAALLGFLYWSSRRGAVATGLAAAHGFGLTATRFAGIPCAFAALFTARGMRGRERAIVLIGISLLGAVLFLVFCHARFGHWDFYFQTLKTSWGIEARPLAPFEISAYAHLFPRWGSPREVSAFSVAITPWLFLAVALAEAWAWRRAGSAAGLRERFPSYLCGVVLFYLAVAATASIRFDSMIRYQFCTYVLLVLPMLHLLTRVPFRTLPARLIAAGAALGFIAAALALQIHYARIFTKGGWFA